MPMTKFREHRGGLEESMKTVVPMSTMKEIQDFAKEQLSIFKCEFRFSEIEVKFYAYDKRIGWDCHIVTMPDYGVLGWTDGMPEK